MVFNTSCSKPPNFWPYPVWYLNSQSDFLLYFIWKWIYTTFKISRTFIFSKIFCSIKPVLIFTKTEMPKIKRSTQKGGPTLSKSGENQVEMYKKEMDTKARNVLCTIIPGNGSENCRLKSYRKYMKTNFNPYSSKVRLLVSDFKPGDVATWIFAKVTFNYLFLILLILLLEHVNFALIRLKNMKKRWRRLKN